MVFVGSEDATEFSYVEYQALNLCLAFVIWMTLAFTEVAMRRFQVLPLLFPGMFTVKDRRMHAFNFDITNGSLGKTIRAEAKMMVRANLCMVLAYLWQYCVVESMQTVNPEATFLIKKCEEQFDCFASEVAWMTLVNQQYQAIDCRRIDNLNLPENLVISCIRFVRPGATKWLMHLAISHSVAQLNIKCFELMVWISGGSVLVRQLLGFLIFASISLWVILFFTGVLTDFMSWLSFVMAAACPVFLHTVRQSGIALHSVRQEEELSMRASLTAHLDAAFEDLEHVMSEMPSTVLFEDQPNKSDSPMGPSATSSVPTSHPQPMMLGHSHTAPELGESREESSFHESHESQGIFARMSTALHGAPRRVLRNLRSSGTPSTGRPKALKDEDSRSPSEPSDGIESKHNSPSAERSGDSQSLNAADTELVQTGGSHLRSRGNETESLITTL